MNIGDCHWNQQVFVADKPSGVHHSKRPSENTARWDCTNYIILAV